MSKAKWIKVEGDKAVELGVDGNVWLWGDDISCLDCARMLVTETEEGFVSSFPPGFCDSCEDENGVPDCPHFDDCALRVGSPPYKTLEEATLSAEFVWAQEKVATSDSGELSDVTMFDVVDMCHELSDAGKILLAYIERFCQKKDLQN